MARGADKSRSHGDAAGGWNRASTSIEAWLVRGYRRGPHRYMFWLLAWSWAMCFFFAAPLGVFFASYFEGATVGQYFFALAVIDVAVFASLMFAVVRSRNTRQALHDWLEAQSGTQTADPAAAFAAAARLPREWVVHLVTAAAVLAPPSVSASVTIPTGHFTPGDVALVTVGSWFVIGYGGLVIYFGMDLGMYPVRAELSRSLKGRSAHLTVVPLATRLVVGLSSLTVLAGWFSATLVTEPGSSVSGAAPAFLWSVLVAATLGLLPMFLIAQSLLAPIRQLIRGTQAVAVGDLESRVPVIASDELGVLQVSFNEMVDGLQDRERLREKNVALVEQLRASQARIVAASDSSRRQVERDLHDGAQQYLVLLELKLGLLTKAVAEDPEASTLAAEVRADLARALAELRDLAHGIYPAVLESEGLVSALQSAGEQSAVPVTIEADGIGRYGPGVEAAVYFCCLEALQNAAKHAGHAVATVRLGQANGHLTFEVADDGRGYDARAISPSAGLQNMSDRIGALGGELQIESTPGVGTTVRGAVPMEMSR